MKFNKQLVAALAVTTIATGGIIGVNAASAHFGGANNTDFANEIATKFNLDASEVESFLEEKKQERHEEMEAARDEKLQALVADGTISQTQKDALDVKYKEMQAAREALQNEDLSLEEFRQRMKQIKDDFRQWAEEQGIDLSPLQQENGRMGHMKGHHNLEN